MPSIRKIALLAFGAMSLASTTTAPVADAKSWVPDMRPKSCHVVYTAPGAIKYSVADCFAPNLANMYSACTCKVYVAGSWQNLKGVVWLAQVY